MDRVGIRCSFSHAVLLSDILNVQISTSVGVSVSVSVSVSVCSFSSDSFFNWVISVFLSFSLFPALTQKIPAPTIRMASTHFFLLCFICNANICYAFSLYILDILHRLSVFINQTLCFFMIFLFVILPLSDFI